MRTTTRSILPPVIFILLGVRLLYPAVRVGTIEPGLFYGSEDIPSPLSRSPMGKPSSHRLWRRAPWRRKRSVRTIMNPELQRTENQKADEGLTGLVGRFSDVAETGASAALVSDPPRAINSLRVLSLLQVQDTLTTLHKLAPSYRQLMPLRPFVFVHEDEISSDVAETGASAALVSDPPRAINSLRVLSLLQVQDTLTTLHKLAPSYRQLMPLRPLWN